MHNDYDCLNKDIIEKYNVKLIDEIKEQVFFKEDKPSILSKEIAFKLIDEISSLNLEDVKYEVLNNEKNWNYYKNLV